MTVVVIVMRFFRHIQPNNFSFEPMLPQFFGEPDALIFPNGNPCRGAARAYYSIKPPGIQNSAAQRGNSDDGLLEQARPHH
jgi:hypothetical protein